MVKAELMSMSQWERDVLKVMAPGLLGKRTQAEAGRLLGLCVRQVRRIEGRLCAGGEMAGYCISCVAVPVIIGLISR